ISPAEGVQHVSPQQDCTQPNPHLQIFVQQTLIPAVRPPGPGSVYKVQAVHPSVPAVAALLDLRDFFLSSNKEMPGLSKSRSCGKPCVILRLDISFLSSPSPGWASEPMSSWLVEEPSSSWNSR